MISYTCEVAELPLGTRTQICSFLKNNTSLKWYAHTVEMFLSLFFFFFNDDVMFWEQGCTPSTCVHNRDWCCDENEPCTNACTEFWGSKSDHHFESSCQVCSSPPPPLLLNVSTGRIFFFLRAIRGDSQTLWGRMVQVWSSVRGMDTPPHKEAREHTEEMMHHLIFDCHVICKLCCYLQSQFYLLSSPPALTTKRSPFVKRTLVRWAEWPRKRLCLA